MVCKLNEHDKRQLFRSSVNGIRSPFFTADERNSLTGLTMSKLHFGRYSVETSSEYKMFFSDAGITKGDLLEYYRNIAGVMIPHMKNRPLMMQRFPDGIDGDTFYQKDIPDYFPDWMDRMEVSKEDGTVTHALCNNAASLVYMANQAAITFHIWLSLADRLHKPDRMIFDLDPGDDDFGKVREAALLLRDFLDELKLNSFVMTTGSRGVHVVVPLIRKNDFDGVRKIARNIAASLAEKHPDELTVEQRIKNRKGRLFLDTNRNAYAQTAVAPYSVRAKSPAPVAAPLHWRELEKGKVNARSFTIRNIFRRLGQIDDPWRKIGQSRCGLKTAEKILGG